MAIEYYEVHVPGEQLYNLPETLKVRKITPIEQKRLLTLIGGDDTTSKDLLQYINQLITGIDPYELYWPDYYYLLYNMRVVTYNKYPLEAKFTCPKCGNVEKVKINIGELETTPVSEELLKGATVELENFGSVPVRYKKVKDDVLIEDFIKKESLDADDVNIRILLADLCLLTEWKSLKELWDYANSGEITVQDTIAVESFFERSTWGIKEEVKYTCKACKEEVSNAFSMQLETFFPSRFTD